MAKMPKEVDVFIVVFILILFVLSPFGIVSILKLIY